MDFVKPNIVMSACLNYAPCRYDGERINDDFLKLLEPFVNCLHVCPEVEIGLGTPRETLRLISEDNSVRLKENKTGRDLTRQMVEFSEDYAGQLQEVQGLVLKSKSPSCGIKDTKLYSSMEKGARSTKVNGLFAQSILNHYTNYPNIDDGRLNDYHIREHFLTRIFLLAAFDQMKIEQSLKALQDFHNRHKMLLLSYNQAGFKRLSNIIGESNVTHIGDTLVHYRQTLIDATTRMPSVKSKINVFLHTIELITHHLTENENDFLLKLIEQYRNQQVPFSSLIVVLKLYAIQYDEQTILNQSFLNPFPEQLIQVRDSGKQII